MIKSKSSNDKRNVQEHQVKSFQVQKKENIISFLDLHDFEGRMKTAGVPL